MILRLRIFRYKVFHKHPSVDVQRYRCFNTSMAKTLSPKPSHVGTKTYLICFLSIFILSFAFASAGKKPGCHAAVRRSLGVLENEKRTSARSIRRVSFSTNFAFLDSAKFKGAWPQFNSAFPKQKEWLSPDHEYAEQIWMRYQRMKNGGEKKKIFYIGEKYDFSAEDISQLREVSQSILLDVIDNLQTNHAEVFATHYDWSPDTGILKSRITGEVFNIREPHQHPLEIAGSLVQEDLVMLIQSGDNYRMVGGFLANPYNWNWHTHMGNTLTQIHEYAGVPAPVIKAIDKLMNTFHVGLSITDRMLLRNNWFVAENPELGNHNDGSSKWDDYGKELSPNDVEANLFLRLERQTIRPFTARSVKKKFLLFTVKQFVYDLPSIAGRSITRDLIQGIEDQRAGEEFDLTNMLLVQEYLRERLAQ